MKKTIIATVALLIAVAGIFAFSIQYRNRKEAENIKSVSTTQHTEKTAQTTVPVQEDESNLIVEDKESGCRLYSDGDKVVVVYGEYTHTFETWAWSIGKEVPGIFYDDYDSDGEKEILIRLVNGVTDDGDLYTYTLYFLKPFVTKNGDKDFKIKIASTNTWKNPFDQAIKCEIIQLKCKKFLQFTMDDINESIVYDSETGITQSEYAGYAKAAANSKKEYYTLDRWNKGAGIYDVDEDGKITLDIQVLVNYKEVKEAQYIGNIHCNLEVINGVFDIVPNTIVFVASEQFKISDPRDTAEDDWKFTLINSSKGTDFDSTEIDWIETEFDLSNTKSEKTESFEKRKSKIKCVDKVEFTQESLTLTAKEGFHFSQRMADKGAFSLTINSGENEESDICYTCEVKTVNNRSILVYTFDKTYDKEDFNNIKLKFGV